MTYRYKKIISCLTVAIMLITTLNFASAITGWEAIETTGDDTQNEKRVEIDSYDDGRQFAVIETTGTTSTSGLRYSVEGWYITANFNGKEPITAPDYYPISHKLVGDSTWVAEIPLSARIGNNIPIYQFLGVPQEYYSLGGTIHFDAAVKIRHNGVLTEPAYGKYSDIIQAIKDRYGVPWSSVAIEDLKTWFDHVLEFQPEKLKSTYSIVSSGFVNDGTTATVDYKDSSGILLRDMMVIEDILLNIENYGEFQKTIQTALMVS